VTGAETEAVTDPAATPDVLSAWDPTVLAVLATVPDGAAVVAGGADAAATVPVAVPAATTAASRQPASPAPSASRAAAEARVLIRWGERKAVTGSLP
jgi:hypothetical protein